MIDVRHVQVEAELHTIGEAAWQHCDRLLLAHLPSTVVCLKRWVLPSMLCTPHVGNVGRIPRGALAALAASQIPLAVSSLLSIQTPKTALQNPIQEDLWRNNQFCLTVCECFLTVENNKNLQELDCETARSQLESLYTDLGILEAKAFHSTARVRHVSLDEEFSTVSLQVWRHCHSLRIVKQPDTEVATDCAVFQGSCCLAAIGAFIGQCAFEECAKFAHSHYRT